LLTSLQFMGVCVDPDAQGALHRRIDIRLWPADQFIPALLYFTGSDELNKAMRRRAIEKNFHLNEYCIK
jgi:DNA polymerase beta